MPTSRNHMHGGSLAVLLAAALAVTGCQARDRAGGSTDVETTTLRFALTGDPGPQITAWADEVDQLSKGTLKVAFVRDTRAGQPDYETGTIADVRTGIVDMASVGARAFDNAGLTSFQPLLTPMLIDSLELEGKVFEAGLPQQVLPSLDQLDLVGVGILPGPIRKVLGVAKPFTTPADFKGQVVGIQASGVADQTFRALGGTTKAVPPGARLTGLDAYDQQLGSIQGNHYNLQAKFVTGNLNLWPRPLVIIANQDVNRRLTDDQRATMVTAAKDAISVAMEAERSGDANAIPNLCKAGLSFAQSSDSDLASFQKALAPVYAAIRKDPANAAVYDKITMIKNTLHRAPDTADCTKVATSTDQPQATRYDGTYEMRIAWPDIKTADARCVGGPESGPEGAIYDMVFDGGTLRLWVRVGGPDAERELGLEVPYQFFKDQLVLTGMADNSPKTTFDFSFEHGRLSLSNARGSDCGGRAIFTTKPWVRQ
jgi:TRAP-type transport system periplasmic protein